MLYCPACEKRFEEHYSNSKIHSESVMLYSCVTPGCPVQRKGLMTYEVASDLILNVIIILKIVRDVIRDSF